MKFTEVLNRCQGQTIVVNNNEERTLVEVTEDFIVLSGGNPQMRITEFVPLCHIVRVIRADYSSGQSSVSMDVLVSGGDQRRNTAH